MDATRDYYTDLELPSTAEVQEIKRQFRKLALKYHPDRNPGREVEVNSKFQIIQSAHEVLTDPQQKAKYDATLSRSGRFPTASGVKGNPWQNVGQQFPPPPRRNTAARNATSGAQRWQSRFSNGVPPTAKQQTPSDAEAKKNAARAFENMRKSQAQAGSKNAQQQARPSQPPPPPPRTESARQRAQAAFGSRRAGTSSVPGDEPHVSAQNYNSRTGTEKPRAPSPPPRKPHPTAMPDPLNQFRARAGFADPRQSTPYSSHGGEKTDPFDGIPPGRSKSAREPFTQDHVPTSAEATFEEQRSTGSSARKFATPRKHGAGHEASERDKAGSPSRAEHRKFSLSESAGLAKLTSAPEPNSEQRSGSAPSMYDTPCDAHPFLHSNPATHGRLDTKSLDSIYGPLADYTSRLGSSGIQHVCQSQPSFEAAQHVMLDRLIKNMEVGLPPERSIARRAESSFRTHGGTELADAYRDVSFNFAIGDDAFESTSPVPDTARSAKSSFDDINTRFVKDDGSSTWQFSAGNGEQAEQAADRPLSAGRANRRSPLKRQPAREAGHVDHQNPPSEPSSGFNANGWSDKFSPQTFVPKPAPSASSSPTRPSRANSKKVRVRPTAGNAAVVEENSSDDETYEWRGRNTQVKPGAADSPQAMDIDSPPGADATSPAEPGSVRNIPVEPSRPEWRPGNVDSMAGETRPERPGKIPINANTAGSEDSEEFKANFAELKTVPPFVQSASGLKSFADLKDNLPFESQASETLPIKLPKVQPLVFPAPPEAPRLPPTVAIEGIKPNAGSWIQYLADFEIYLEKWDEFNGQVVDHFATRKAHISRTRSSNGYSFLGARSDVDVREYFNWVQQDNDVRQRWNACCDQHEKRLREFMAFREKMK